jgi:hypothetical protein
VVSQTVVKDVASALAANYDACGPKNTGFLLSYTCTVATAPASLGRR